MSGWGWLLAGSLTVGAVLGAWIGFARARWVFRRIPSFARRGMFLLGGLTITIMVALAWPWLLTVATWRVATDRTKAP